MIEQARTRRSFLKRVGMSGAALTAGAHSLASPEGGANPVTAAIEHHPSAEFAIDPPRDEAAWSGVTDGLHVSVASKDVSYLRHEVPRINPSTRWTGSCWRGERVNIPIIIWTRTGEKQVRLRPGPLRSQQGHTIPTESMQARFARYVVSNLPFGSTSTSCEAADLSASWLLPDPLDPVESYDLEATSARLAWLTVEVPPNAVSGSYSGRVQVTGQGGDQSIIQIDLHVSKAVVPAPADWRFRLDLWQNPWAVAHCHGVQPWSPAHIEILKPHLRMLAEAGAKFITTYVCHSPWKDDTYVADSTMVEWIRERDGSWRFEYDLFDRYVELAASCGITDAITAYTLLPWRHRVRFLDAASGHYVWEEWPPTGSEFGAFWGAFLQDFRDHLKRKGWFEKTYIGINENPLEDTLAAIKTVHKDSRDWKITYAGHWHSELNTLLDDYCAIIDDQVPSPEVETRLREGKTTTFYVCCHPAKPNNFTFSPPAEGRWMGWHAAARGLHGFLRWAYDSWTADPLRDTRHVLWPAGDCFLVYPGTRSGIRFEMLREGIVDFEKIRVLEQRLAALDSDEARAGLEKLRSTLALFQYDRVQAEPASSHVKAGQDLLNELTALAYR